MDWIHRFITENILFLLSKTDKTETIRMKKKEFFHSHSLKSSDSFTLKELAFETIRYLMGTNKIKSEADLRKFKENSLFLSEYTSENDVQALEGLLSPLQSDILTPDDLKKLSQGALLKEKSEEMLIEARKIVEQEIDSERKKAMEQVQLEREHLEEMRADLEKRKEEVIRMESLLDALPATIDTEDYVSSEEEKPKITSRSTIWWERLGLSGDPFPTKLGLDLIPEAKYDAIVVTTEIFSRYLRLIEGQPRSLFGKTILISGQFGAGKSTFLQYIAHRIAEKQIIPFKLFLEPVGEIDILRQSFYSELYNTISRAMKQRGLADPRPHGVFLDKIAIGEALSDLMIESKVEGFIIMIDGLHKAESTLETSLEFVKQLQNIHEYLNGIDLKVGIFITISPLWFRRVTQNPSYGGSYYQIDEVPNINFEDAFLLLRKRIKAYANPEVPIFIDKEAIGYAFQRLSSGPGGTGITFRDFIDYVLPRLEKGAFKEVGISVSVDVEDLRKIDKLLRASVIKDAYLQYLELAKDKKKTKRACLVVLRKIHKKYYLGEKDYEFQVNRGAFYTLRNSHLIQKTNTGGDVGWALSSDFMAALEDLNDEGYPPVAVFQAFSTSISDLTIKKDTMIDPLLENAQDFLAKYESEWPELVTYVKDFINSHKTIIESYSSVDRSGLICEDSSQALSKLIQCVQIILGNSQSPEEWVRSTWLDIPISPTIISVLKQESLADTDPDEYYQRYHQSIKAMFVTLTKLLQVNRIINFLASKNGKEELRVLFKAGSYLEDGNLEKAIEEINSSIEKRIRTVFHLAFSLNFGSNYVTSLPKSAQDRIQTVENRGIQPLKRSLDQNLFYHLSRSEYANIVSESRNWNLIMNKIFSPKSREEVVKALQLTFGLDDRKQHRDRPDYFRKTREEIRQAIVNADWILYNLAQGLRLSLKPNGFSQIKQEGFNDYRVSFLGQEQCASSHLWQISAGEENEIAKRLTAMPREVNFENDLAVSTQFGGSLPQIAIIAASLSRKGLLEIQDVAVSRMNMKIVPKKQQTLM